MGVVESGWEWVRVDGVGGQWMGVSESGWGWMTVNDSG